MVEAIVSSTSTAGRPGRPAGGHAPVPVHRRSRRRGEGGSPDGWLRVATALARDLDVNVNRAGLSLRPAGRRRRDRRPGGRGAGGALRRAARARRVAERQVRRSCSPRTSCSARRVLAARQIAAARLSAGDGGDQRVDAAPAQARTDGGGKVQRGKARDHQRRGRQRLAPDARERGLYQHAQREAVEQQQAPLAGAEELTDLRAIAVRPLHRTNVPRAGRARYPACLRRRSTGHITACELAAVSSH